MFVFNRNTTPQKIGKNSELILLPGEMAIESDTGKFKFGGNGKKFSELDYAGIDQAQLDATNDSFTKLTPADDVTDSAALAGIAFSQEGRYCCY